MLPSLYRRSFSILGKNRIPSLPREKAFLSPSHRLFFSKEEKVAEEKAPLADEQVDKKAGEDKPEPTPIADELTRASAELEKAQATVKELHHKLLLKYANAENKRRERSDEIRRRNSKNILTFGQKTLGIYESLAKVCDLAQDKANLPEAEEKVKSLSEGLVMTRDIFKNILSKHNIEINQNSSR